MYSALFTKKTEIIYDNSSTETRLEKEETMKLKKIVTAILPGLITLCLSAVPSLAAESAAEAAVSSTEVSAEAPANEEIQKTLTILATSDLHGKFYPWDYALNEESLSGSCAQLVTAIRENYDPETTILVDAGDTIQDNSADIFLDEDIHPMIQALNYIGYDVWTVGNHEFNYGLGVTKQAIAGFNGAPLVGNVYDPDGNPLADGYAILEKNGLRIAVIGMVTPNIVNWDSTNLEGCTVTDPVEETQKILKEIDGQYDVLLGVIHMGLDNEYELSNSGATDFANALPEFDAVVAAHQHIAIAGEEVNGVLIVENSPKGQTMNKITLTLEETGDGWTVTGRASETIEIGGYEPDPVFMDTFAGYHDYAVTDASIVIGKLEGGPLAPENEIAVIPSAQIEDTALIDLINEVQLYYTGADVSAAALFTAAANMYPGDIRKCDTALIYKFANTLYKVRMTGAKLKKYMEWSAGYYNTFHEGDLTVSFNPDIPGFNYDMFAGVNYEINIANEPGSRIENLTWPDGTPVKDDDEFVLVVNNYRCNSQLRVPGVIYEEDELPEILAIDVHGELGGVREMIGKYIVDVKGGTITPEVDNNWKLTGCNWDEELHKKAVEMIASGEITVPSSEDGAAKNAKSVTVEDIQ